MHILTILKTPVKFEKDWPKTVGGVAGRLNGGGADGRTDTQNFRGYNIIPHFLVAGHKNEAMQQDMVMTPIWQQRLMIAKIADAS